MEQITEDRVRKIVRDVIIEEGLISPNKKKDGGELIRPKETDERKRELIPSKEDDRGNNEIQKKDE